MDKNIATSHGERTDGASEVNSRKFPSAPLKSPELSRLEESLQMMPGLHNQVNSLRKQVGPNRSYEEYLSLAGKTVTLYRQVIEGGYYSTLHKMCGAEKRPSLEALVGKKGKQDILGFLQDTTTLVKSLAADMKSEIYMMSDCLPYEDSIEGRQRLASHCKLYTSLVANVNPQKGSDGLHEIIDNNIECALRFNKELLERMPEFDRLVASYAKEADSQADINQYKVKLAILRDSVKELPKRFAHKGKLRSSYDVSAWLKLFDAFGSELNSLKNRKLFRKLKSKKRMLECSTTQDKAALDFLESTPVSADEDYVCRLSWIELGPEIHLGDHDNTLFLSSLIADYRSTRPRAARILKTAYSQAKTRLLEELRKLDDISLTSDPGTDVLRINKGIRALDDLRKTYSLLSTPPKDFGDLDDRFRNYLGECNKEIGRRRDAAERSYQRDHELKVKKIDADKEVAKSKQVSDKRIDVVDGRVSEVKQDVKEVKQEVSQVKEEVVATRQTVIALDAVVNKTVTATRGIHEHIEEVREESRMQHSVASGYMKGIAEESAKTSVSKSVAATRDIHEHIDEVREESRMQHSVASGYMKGIAEESAKTSKRLEKVESNTEYIKKDVEKVKSTIAESVSQSREEQSTYRRQRRRDTTRNLPPDNTYVLFTSAVAEESPPSRRTKQIEDCYIDERKGAGSMNVRFRNAVTHMSSMSRLDVEEKKYLNSIGSVMRKSSEGGSLFVHIRNMKLDGSLIGYTLSVIDRLAA
ncbi:hypothetical protein ACFL3V_02590 [Nanoarchaeota archaeon]